MVLFTCLGLLPSLHFHRIGRHEVVLMEETQLHGVLLDCIENKNMYRRGMYGEREKRLTIWTNFVEGIGEINFACVDDNNGVGVQKRDGWRVRRG
jgi:hypothetical protein